MNSPVRSLDKPKNRAAYLRFGLKQNWQQLVFYAIIMLLACVVTSIIVTATILEEIQNGFSMYHTPAHKGADLFRDIALIFAVVSCVLGVFSGMSATGYVNSRRAIHCYHSLPLTRDALYLEGSAVQVLYYLVTSLVSLLIGTLVIVSQLGMTGESVGEGLLLILTGIGGYLLVFSLFQLAGTLTGTAVFRFIAAGIIAFLPVLVYLMIYAGADTGMSNLMVDYYMDYNQIRFLCPAFNIYYAMAISYGDAYVIDDNVITVGYTLWSIATLYLTAVFYYLLGLWLHRKRRSELSESSLIWKKLTAFVKYPVIFVCGAGGAIFFRAALGTDITWMIFGGFCGLVLSFLLMNVLITRNTKSMFKGLPGLGITALVVAFFLVVLPFDVFGFNNFMYDADQVKSVTVYYGDKEVVFAEEDEIAAVMPYIAELTRNTEGNQTTPYDAAFMRETSYYIDPETVLNQSEKEARSILSMQYPDRGVRLDMPDEKPTFVWMGGKMLDDHYNIKCYEDGYITETSAARYYEGVTATETKYYDPSEGITSVYKGDYSYDWDRLEVSVYPKFGIPIHRYMRVLEVSENAAVFDVIQNTEQYAAYYRELADIKADDLHSMYINLLDESVNIYTGSAILGGEEMLKANEKAMAILQKHNALLETLLKAASVLTPEMTDTPVIGSISIHSETISRTYNLYAGMTQFWDAWLAYWEQMPEFMDNPDLKLGQSNSTKAYYDMLRYTNYRLYEDGKDIMDWAASFHTDTYIIEADTGRALYVDPDKMAQVLENSMDDYTLGLQEPRFMVVSHKYTIDAMKEGVENILADGRVPDGYNKFFFFRKDAVPQFVLDAFSK